VFQSVWSVKAPLRSNWLLIIYFKVVIARPNLKNHLDCFLFAFFENFIFQKRSADEASLVGEARLIAKVEIEEGKTALTTTAAPSKNVR